MQASHYATGNGPPTNESSVANIPRPVRTRWVDYKNHDFDAAQIEPGWHAWMSYAVDKAPSQDPTLAYKRRAWEDTDYKTIPNYTLTRGAYKPYNTYAAQSPRQRVCKLIQY